MPHLHAAATSGPTAIWQLTAMWFVMMAAMMSPTVWPWVRSFHRFAGPQPNSARLAGTAQFVAGYLCAWLGYSVAAAGFQQTVQWAQPGAGLAAAVFIVAGVYQLAPLKSACLTHCRSPFSYFLARWKNGPTGGFRMGLHHGVFCVGCCWALMATTLAVGIMNLWWMAALSVVALMEQVAPHGDKLRIPLGLALLSAGLWRLI